MTKDEGIWNVDVVMKFLDDEEYVHQQKMEKGETKR